MIHPRRAPRLAPNCNPPRCAPRLAPPTLPRPPAARTNPRLGLQLGRRPAKGQRVHAVRLLRVVVRAHLAEPQDDVLVVLVLQRVGVRGRKGRGSGGWRGGGGGGGAGRVSAGEARPLRAPRHATAAARTLWEASSARDVAASATRPSAAAATRRATPMLCRWLSRRGLRACVPRVDGAVSSSHEARRVGCRGREQGRLCGHTEGGRSRDRVRLNECSL